MSNKTDVHGSESSQSSMDNGVLTRENRDPARGKDSHSPETIITEDLDVELAHQTIELFDMNVEDGTVVITDATNTKVLEMHKETREESKSEKESEDATLITKYPQVVQTFLKN